MNNLLNATVFIVDDDPFTCLLYKKFLSNLGFSKTHHFLNGQDCLNKLHLNPEIVLLDHQMHEITGFEILKKIKRSMPNAAVIMVSGQEDMTTALDSLRYGAFDYVIKDNNETTKIKNALERLSSLNLIQLKPKPSFLNRMISFK